MPHPREARPYPDRGRGTANGLPEQLQDRYVTKLAKATDGEKVRLTTSGTLATMYAMMLARAFTERDLVVKMGGGWHGANPLALKGVAYACGATSASSRPA